MAIKHGRRENPEPVLQSTLFHGRQVARVKHLIWRRRPRGSHRLRRRRHRCVITTTCCRSLLRCCSWLRWLVCLCRLNVQLQVSNSALWTVCQWQFPVKSLSVELGRIYAKLPKEAARCPVCVVNFEHKGVSFPKARDLCIVVPHWVRIVVDRFRFDLGIPGLVSNFTLAIGVSPTTAWQPICITQPPGTHNSEPQWSLSCDTFLRLNGAWINLPRDRLAPGLQGLAPGITPSLCIICIWDLIFL
mmetsp:Transcript_67374/g.132906  ORF Transcript_67374/g.132906 Transcript_67374/m.132906 type:complete len:245 (-) Transcript_67374:769-1503(-)